MNIYDIDRDLENIQLEIAEFAQENDGEICNELLLEEQAILNQLDNKRENFGLYIKNQDAFIKALKDEKAKIDYKIKVATNSINRSKDYLSGYMNGKKFSNEKVSISFRKSESVSILDGSSVPSEYKTIVETEKISKADIKKALKQGLEVSGAQLETKQNIQIK